MDKAKTIKNHRAEQAEIFFYAAQNFRPKGMRLNHFNAVKGWEGLAESVERMDESMKDRWRCRHMGGFFSDKTPRLEGSMEGIQPIKKNSERTPPGDAALGTELGIHPQVVAMKREFLNSSFFSLCCIPRMDPFVIIFGINLAKLLRVASRKEEPTFWTGALFLAKKGAKEPFFLKPILDWHWVAISNVPRFFWLPGKPI